jgi:hypothetical protein
MILKRSESITDDRLALGSLPVHYYNIFESLTKFFVRKSMINAITNASENIMRDCPKPPSIDTKLPTKNTAVAVKNLPILKHNPVANPLTCAGKAQE